MPIGLTAASFEFGLLLSFDNTDIDHGIDNTVTTDDVTHPNLDLRSSYIDMSDKHSSHNTADTQEITPQGSLGNLDEPSSPPTNDAHPNDAHQTELELAQPKTPESTQLTEEADWEEVPLPGTLASHTVTTERETELLTLIHDLNECNDVLLARISQLEGDLEKTQSTLKTEMDKASFAQEKMAKQVSAEQTSAQQVSQNAQQQVGKLVSQLEANEQLLNRQQLINENLQTELTNSQERITQLERECALASQQYADEAKARVKADTTNRDLRSRLQRQQRYTLQFKAALEKSLTVSTRTANNTVNTAQPVSFNSPPATTPAAVTMPKAQRIMPWAAAATSPFQGIDPHLETLIRNAGKPTNIEAAKPDSLIAEPTETHDKITAPSSPSITTSSGAQSTADSGAQGTADSEAEAKLWQDLERVINAAAEAKTPSQSAVKTVSKETVSEETVLKKTSEATTVTASADSVAETAPAVGKSSAEKPSSGKRFNWQKNVAKASSTETVAEATTAATAMGAATEAESKAADAAIAPEPHPPTETKTVAKEAFQTAQRVATPIPPLSQPMAQQPFTEPSPWGKPLPESVPAKPTAANKSAKAAIAAPSLNLPTSSDYLPVLDGPADSAISPVVNPLRTQKKKVKSLAAVELPTFQTAKAGSFKR